MSDLLKSLDWMQLIQTIWTVVLVPIFGWAGKELHDWAKARKIEKYTDMLYAAVAKVVKEMYQTVVNSIKGTADWRPEKQAEILEIAKTKIIAAITSDGYDLLREANRDFEDWLTSLIEAELYDLKYGKSDK